MRARCRVDQPGESGAEPALRQICPDPATRDRAPQCPPACARRPRTSDADTLKLAPGVGEVVFDVAGGRSTPADHPGLRETPPAPHQQRGCVTQRGSYPPDALLDPC